VGGDQELLRKLCQVFQEDYPRLLREIHEAIRQQHAHHLNLYAHALKGSVLNFGARAASAAALRLEVMGKDGHLLEAEEAAGMLETEMNRVLPALAAFDKDFSANQEIRLGEGG
jgi:histidine phosphotransfer protein HptB